METCSSAFFRFVISASDPFERLEVFLSLGNDFSVVPTADPAVNGSSKLNAVFRVYKSMIGRGEMTMR